MSENDTMPSGTSMKSALKFITWPAIAGLLAALLILDRVILPTGELTAGSASGTVSYSRAVRAASPAVVNIYTAKLIRSRRNPVLDDPIFRNFAPTRPQRRQLPLAPNSAILYQLRG